MRFFIHTLGCKVNQYESQAIRESLLERGLEESRTRGGADIFVLNTCTVTEKADKESRYMVGLFRRRKPGAKILVTGCYAEKDAGEIASLRGVTHIVKNVDKGAIADILSASPADPLPRIPGSAIRTKITGFHGHSKAFVKVQDGCENACAYCKVPLVRGSLKSRPLNDIIDEISGLVSNGYREIVLTGICLGAWGRDLFPESLANALGMAGASLADVLSSVDRMPGEFRVRLSSIEPKYLTDEIISIIRSSKRICRHLHIPLQSGDDYILNRMKRQYTANDFAGLVENARQKIEGLAVTTDLIVGFPGESDDSFRNTLEFVRRISPSRTHIFTFSRRPGTAAYDMDQAVDPKIAGMRRRELEGVAMNASYLFARAFIGRSLQVLVEGEREKESGLLTGYSDNYIKVIFSGPDDMMGRIVTVKITDADPAKTMGIVENV